MRTFEVVYPNQPWRNRKFKVRGVCENDVLNPCWDNRPDDIPGKFWGEPDIAACPACTKEAQKSQAKATRSNPTEYCSGQESEDREFDGQQRAGIREA